MSEAGVASRRGALPTLERVWLTYLGCVIAVALLAPGGGSPGHRPGAFLGLHGGLLLLHLLLGHWTARVGAQRARPARALAALVSLPLVFSSLAWLLPGVHPEPWEWTWLAWDRAVLGLDPTVALQGLLVPVFTELLQWCYAAFYFLPIGACLLAAGCRGGAAFDRAMTLVVFGFLLSYLGYLLFPTLPPYRFLDHGPPLQGVWLTTELNRLLYEAEANRWDCFPSGHTMLALCSVWLVVRWARRWLWLYVPVTALLVLSTLALRYHWLIDVLAGAALVWPAVWLGDRMLDRDSAAPA